MMQNYDEGGFHNKFTKTDFWIVPRKCTIFKVYKEMNKNELKQILHQITPKEPC